MSNNIVTAVVFILKIGVIISIGYIRDSTAENVSEENESEENSSLNSESLEFNASSTENRIDAEDTSGMESDKLRFSKVTVTTLKPEEVTENENRISNEVNQTKSQKHHVNYPYSVSIQRKSSHYASGALVDKQWILTAAREFYNVRESIKLFKARLGSVNCKRGGVLIPIKRIELHPSYLHNRPAFDVALLKLATPAEYTDFVTPIAISKTTGRVVSAKFLVTYWPRLIVNGEILPPSAKERFKQNSMRVSTQKVIPREKCENLLLGRNVTLERSNICLESIVSHHTPCLTDPGAPVVAKDGLWGITSGWTSKKCVSPQVTLFTRLSSPYVRSWLELFLEDI